MAPSPVSAPIPPTHSLAAAPSSQLQRALESLMVSLDDELLRFRQSRTGQGTTTVSRGPLKFRNKPSRPSPSLIHLPPSAPSRPAAQASATQTTAQPSTPRMTGPGMPPPPPRPWRTTHPASATPAASPLGEKMLPPTLGMAPYAATQGTTLAPYQTVPDDYLESTEALLGSTPMNRMSPYAEIPSYPHHHEEEDYQPSLARQLATPLGVGALLLLLVGSAGFGYLVTSPEAVEHLRNHAWVQRLQPRAQVAETEPTTADLSPSEMPTGLQGIGPDLSGQEFGSLDLDRISNLPSDRASSAAPDFSPLQTDATRGGMAAGQGTAGNPGAPGTATMRAETVAPLAAANPTTGRSSVPPQPTTTPSSRTARPAPVTASPSAVVPRSVQSTQVPLPIAAPPAPAQPPQPLSRAATAPAPAASVQPPAPLTPTAANPSAARPNYYVVTEYNGQQSLESAQGAVGDAYVRDFSGGTKIQMGAFSQESSARNLAEQLQQQGIPAQVYTP